MEKYFRRGKKNKTLSSQVLNFITPVGAFVMLEASVLLLRSQVEGHGSLSNDGNWVFYSE